MMSSSNYSIGLQCLKPVHTAYCAICVPIRKLLNWSWARDVNDRDETETSASRDRDVDNFSRDETSRDRDVETETTSLEH